MTGGCSGSNGSQTFTTSESAISSFTAVSSNTAFATVAASPSTPGQFVVTPTSSDKQLTDTSTIKVTDGSGNSTTVALKFYGVCLP